jgi:hypothetical protein
VREGTTRRNATSRARPRRSPARGRSAGDAAGARRELELPREDAAAIEDAEDRELVLADFATMIPI